MGGWEGVRWASDDGGKTVLQVRVSVEAGGLSQSPGSITHRRHGWLKWILLVAQCYKSSPGAVWLTGDTLIEIMSLLMKSETGLWEEEWEQDKKVRMCEKRHKDNEHKRSPSLVETRHEVTQASGLLTGPLFWHTDKAWMTLTTNLINAVLIWDGIHVSEKGWTVLNCKRLGVRVSARLPPEPTQESPLKPSDDGDCVVLLWFLLIFQSCHHLHRLHQNIMSSREANQLQFLNGDGQSSLVSERFLQSVFTLVQTL